MFTSDGKKFSSEAGNAYWGLIDGWRRPKPELWQAKLVFSPVWFPKRQLDWDGRAEVVKIPVENRYSFTDLNELKFTWTYGDQRGQLHVDLAPGAKGEIRPPLPKNAKIGDSVALAVFKGNELVNSVLIHLGDRPLHPLPVPSAGAPAVTDDGNRITIQGDTFGFVIDKKAGEFIAADPLQRAAVVRFPRLHATRFDYGDLASGMPPYAVLPDEKTRDS